MFLGRKYFLRLRRNELVAIARSTRFRVRTSCALIDSSMFSRSTLVAFEVSLEMADCGDNRLRVSAVRLILILTAGFKLKPI